MKSFTQISSTVTVTKTKKKREKNNKTTMTNIFGGGVQKVLLFFANAIIGLLTNCLKYDLLVKCLSVKFKIRFQFYQKEHEHFSFFSRIFQLISPKHMFARIWLASDKTLKHTQSHCEYTLNYFLYIFLSKFP